MPTFAFPFSETASFPSIILNFTAMGVTRLKRKEKRNRAKATNRQTRIKQLMERPVIKNVDIEAIKEEFKANLAAKKD